MLVEELAHAPRELALGAADELLLGERSKTRSEIAAASRIVAISAGLLDRAQALDEPGLGDGLDAAVAQLLVRGDGDDVRLDPDRPAREPRREVADDRARGLLEADAVERARLLRVAEVGEERRLAVRLDEHGRVRALRGRSGSGR